MVKNENKQVITYDFSKFNQFFGDVISLKPFINYLEGLNTAYLKLSLDAAMEYIKSDGSSELPDDNMHYHQWALKELIKLFKSLEVSHEEKFINLN